MHYFELGFFQHHWVWDTLIVFEILLAGALGLFIVKLNEWHQQFLAQKKEWLQEIRTTHQQLVIANEGLVETKHMLKHNIPQWMKWTMVALKAIQK